MSKRVEAPFFVGYLPMPKPLAGFYFFLIPAILACLGGLAVGFTLAQASPGDGSYGPRVREPITGVLQTAPYPLLRLPADEDHPTPRTVILVEGNKRGPQDRAAGLDGEWVDATGVFIGRDGFAVLQLGGSHRLSLADAAPSEPFTPAARIPLGSYTLRGEIVDCKCYAGAMAPGTGKPHVSCANLCLLGGIPPVLVTHLEDGSSQHFLLVDEDGGPLDDEIYGVVGQAVQVSGRVEQLDDLFVLRVDPMTAEAL